MSSFSTIEQALFAAIELADRSEGPCLMCGLHREEPRRWVRGTQPMPIVKPKIQERETCEPDLIFTSPISAVATRPPAKVEHKSALMVALGTTLMVAGAHYVLASLGLRH
ncbi:MAG: hypothetical protein GY811_16010 [Myxococcales bacterium]|nr:hypothetical protein [Myxococcales bacterium]